jgi:hypothetical protein
MEMVSVLLAYMKIKVCVCIYIYIYQENLTSIKSDPVLWLEVFCVHNKRTCLSVCLSVAAITHQRLKVGVWNFSVLFERCAVPLTECNQDLSWRVHSNWWMVQNTSSALKVKPNLIKKVSPFLNQCSTPKDDNIYREDWKDTKYFLEGFLRAEIHFNFLAVTYILKHVTFGWSVTSGTEWAKKQFREKIYHILFSVWKEY